MTPNELQDALTDLLDEVAGMDWEDRQDAGLECAVAFEDLDEVLDYKSEGILTNDAGVVVRMKDGSEFQVTIVKSR